MRNVLVANAGVVGRTMRYRRDIVARSPLISTRVAIAARNGSPEDGYHPMVRKPQMQRRPPPLANIVTLGVQNFDAQRNFYRQLGWPQAFDSDDFAVFELRGALLALFPIDKLASDAHAQPEPGRGGIRFSIIINVDTPEEVDEFAARVRQAGGKLTKNPIDAEFFVGRDAYFADPEGNYWEIACAPTDNPVAVASRRAAGLSPPPTRVNRGGKAGPGGKKK